jgi:hypothetical protein
VRYRFTRTVAHVKIALGVIIMVAGAVLAILVFSYPAFVEGVSPQSSRRDLTYRFLSAAILLGAGVVIGAAFVVLGQLVLVLLDIRARLARIDRRLPRREDPADRPPVTERMRPRL